MIITLINKHKFNFEKIYFYTILLFALTMPLSHAIISFFSILFVLLWLYEGDFNRKFIELRESKLFLAFSLFIGYSLLSIFFSSDIQEALHIMREESYWIIIFIIMTSINRDKIQTIITAFLLGMFISEILSYGIFFNFWGINGATPQNPTPFMSHIEYSVYLALTSILLLNRLISKRYTPKEKIITAIFFSTVTGNLFLNAGRTGEVAFLAGIIIMSIIHFKMTLKSLVVSLLLITTIFTTALQISHTFHFRVNQAISDINKAMHSNFDSSLGIRIAFYKTSYDIIKEHPFGVGIGDFKHAQAEAMASGKYNYFDVHVKKFISTNYPHNQYLLVLLQLGFIGLLLFLYIIYTLLKLQIKDKEIKEMSILFVTIFFTSCMPEVLLSRQFTIALFVLFIGLFASASRQNKLQEK